VARDVEIVNGKSPQLDGLCKRIFLQILHSGKKRVARRVVEMLNDFAADIARCAGDEDGHGEFFSLLI